MGRTIAASDPDSLLRMVLRANATFSALCATALLLASGRLAGWLGAPRSILLGIGAGLALFVVDLLVTSTKRPIPRRKARLFVGMDVAWVLASGILLLVPTPLTAAGRLAVIVVALVVAGFAALQIAGMRAAGASETTGPANVRGEGVRSDADPGEGEFPDPASHPDAARS